MDFKELGIGTRLELELQSKDEKSSYVYISQLLEPVKDNHFVIAAPIFEARLIYIPAESRIRIAFNHYKYGLLGFMAVVKRKEMRGNIAVMIMRVDGQIENVQRRTFYRLECLLDAEYRLHITDANNENPSPYKKAVVKNISGSGACIIVEDAVAKNILLDLDIHFNYGDIKTVCKVVRTAVIESSKGRKHELGVHFTEISPKERDIIIRFVFEQQRLLLKKEVTGR